MTDCYQPGEKQFELTRQCLEVMEEFKNPVGIITKNRLVTRDIDLFSRFATWDGVCVIISITTLDADLCGKLEPRASRPAARLEAIKRLAGAGIPVGVNAAPLIPGLTDNELPDILKASASAGATFGGYSLVRLPGAVEGIFQNWLDKNVPGSASKVMNHVRAVHGGRAQDSRFGVRMKGDGIYADQIRALFNVTKSRLGLKSFPTLNAGDFKRPQAGQLSMFD